MRDIATYEVNVCDSINVRQNFAALYDLVKQTKVKVNSLNGLNEMFLGNLMQKVA